MQRPVAVPEQHLGACASAVREQEEIPGQRVGLQLRDDQCVEAVVLLAHVHRARVGEDPDPPREADHASRRRSCAACSSRSPSTRTPLGAIKREALRRLGRGHHLDRTQHRDGRGGPSAALPPLELADVEAGLPSDHRPGRAFPAAAGCVAADLIAHLAGRRGRKPPVLVWAIRSRIWWAVAIEGPPWLMDTETFRSGQAGIKTGHTPRTYGKSTATFERWSSMSMVRMRPSGLMCSRTTAQRAALPP